jgi:hypothetical protein
MGNFDKLRGVENVSQAELGSANGHRSTPCTVIITTPITPSDIHQLTILLLIPNDSKSIIHRVSYQSVSTSPNHLIQ